LVTASSWTREISHLFHLHRNGNLISIYNGQRKAEYIANWARYLTQEIVRPTSTKLNLVPIHYRIELTHTSRQPALTTELVQQAEESNKAVLVGFYKVDPNPRKSANSKGVDEHTLAFLRTREAVADLPVVFTTSDEYALFMLGLCLWPRLTEICL